MTLTGAQQLRQKKATDENESDLQNKKYSRILSVMSLACGGIGLILFLVYKFFGLPKKSIPNILAKFLITWSIIFLAIAVFLLTKITQAESIYKPIGISA